MATNRVKVVLRPLYTRCFGTVKVAREKSALRRQVMRTPITRTYPFDAEVKILRCLGMKREPMFDIGANTGLYSAVLEDIVGSRNLHIVEPLPHLHRYLKDRFRRSNVFDVALSDREGTRRLRVPYVDGTRFDTRASFNEHIEPGQTAFEETEVRTCRLDYLVSRLELESIGFIKIDVEGHESEVFEGGTDTLRRFRPLVLVEAESRHHSYPIQGIFDKFERIGYRGYYVRPESLELLPVSQFETARDQKTEDLTARRFPLYLNNFFFVDEAREGTFVAGVIAVLDSEKRLVERFSQPQSVDTQS